MTLLYFWDGKNPHNMNNFQSVWDGKNPHNMKNFQSVWAGKNPHNMNNFQSGSKPGVSAVAV